MTRYAMFITAPPARESVFPQSRLSRRSQQHARLLTMTDICITYGTAVSPVKIGSLAKSGVAVEKGTKEVISANFSRPAERRKIQ
jgi:hypothetical protein